MAKKDITIEMVSVAKLEPITKIYMGIDVVTKSELTEQHIPVPKDCDLAIGGYFWSEEEKCFMATKAFVQQNLKKNRRV
jgi:hypothetical protein